MEGQRHTFPAFIHSFIFIFIWLCWVFIAARRLSLVVASGGYSSLRCTGFSLQWLLLSQSMGSKRAGFNICSTRALEHVGFSSCGTWAQKLWLTGSRAQAQKLWCMGLDAPWHVGSSWTRNRTHIPCTGRWILNHCATREALSVYFCKKRMQGHGFESCSGKIPHAAEQLNPCTTTTEPAHHNY